MSEISNCVERVKLAKSEAAEMDKKKDKLVAKHRALSLELAAMKGSVAKAESEKIKALSRFAIDGISQEKLDHAREVHEKELKKSLELAELIAAVEQEWKKIEAAMPEYLQRVQEAEKAFWAALFEDVQRELNVLVSEKLPVAYIALSFSGGNWLRWENMLITIFGPENNSNDRNALATQILQKYSL